MENHLAPGDPILVENIVSYFKAMGVFDEFRHEFLADVDTKSSCQNLSQRVDGHTAKFLANETFSPDLKKNEVRNKLRKHMNESVMLAVGSEHVAEQVINPKIQPLFWPKVVEIVHQYIDKEKQKLCKKQESVNLEKSSTETTNKAKTTTLDPIAEILSFTYSKPTASTSGQNMQPKVSDVSKVEKKKQEIAHQAKTSESTLKFEKRKEDIIQPIKTTDILTKVKKEVTEQASSADVVPNVKKEEVETEMDELANEGAFIASQAKYPEDSKEVIKPLKDVKIEDCEAGLETLKKAEEENVKYEKNKVESLKLQVSEKLLHSEESSESKSPSVKGSSSSKSKLEPFKHKKSASKTSIKVGESHKSYIKESSDSSSDKTPGDQSKTTKISKESSLKCASTLKNTISSTMVKCEKRDPKGTPNKSSEESVSSKVGSLKKEDSSMKLKHEPSDSKSDAKIQSESSSSSDKASKHTTNYSSSYDSSQGSDPDRSSSCSSKGKLKHFSKHQRKDSSSVNSMDSQDKKQSLSDSDSGTPNKEKAKKESKYPTEEQHKTFSVQKSVKITSRSDSFNSVSSTSDSHSSLLVFPSGSISSGEASDTSSKNSENKKKPASKDKKPCSSFQNLPPPSPPPPTTGLSMPGPSSAEMSSMAEEAQSSQESESESSGSSDEEIEYDGENSCDSTSNQELSLKTIKTFDDPNEIFPFSSSSSSSEFEGFSSSPEKAPEYEEAASDASVSSVHTSDLSSFEDELSDDQCSSNPNEEGKSKKKFTIKEAEEILKVKAEQQRINALKTSPQTPLQDKKDSRNSTQSSKTVISLSKTEVSPPPEPKRESRRERKLNPKYASSEYTSIFNSKRTSFITKQANQSEVKQANNTDVKLGNLPSKEVLSTKRKSSVTTPDKNLLNDVGTKETSGESAEYVVSVPSASNKCGSVVLEYRSEDISQIKTISNTSEKNHITLAETDSPNRIALKIKLSAIKNDNETNKDTNARGTKKKFEDAVKSSAKSNSVKLNSLESIANENKPFNNKSKLPPNDKEIFHKQKVNNNGDVLNKIEHSRKNSHSKPNHVNEKQTED